jgi:IgGFc binding protein
MVSRAYRLTPAIAVLLALGLGLGCATDPGAGDGFSLAEVGLVDAQGDGDATPQDAAPDLDAPDAPPPDGAQCWPGTHNGCALDGRSVLVCLGDGSGFAAEACVSESGGPGACIAGSCTRCLPGERVCKNEDEVWQCDDTGQAEVLYQDCNGAATGQVCNLGACQGLCELSLKWNSYMGCDYWGADLDNAFVSGGEDGYYDAQGKQYAIVVSNPHPEYPATVTIEWFDEALGVPVEVLGSVYDPDLGPELGFSELFATAPIAPGELRTFNLPRRDVNGSVQAPLAYHVRASIPVTAYQFNPLDNEGVFSNDASLLLPSNVLGSYYYVMTREQTFNTLRGYLTVIAVEAGETKVEVRVTAPTLVGAESNLPHYEPGDSFLRTLRQYDVLNIETDALGADLTGSRITTSKRVAVFGGSEAANAPNTNHCGADGLCEWDGETECQAYADCMAFNTCCADHLEQQLFPVKSWGKRYLAAKSFDRGLEADVWRVIASEDGTQVTTIPVQIDIPVLNAGEWVDFESREHFELHAKKPVMVGQFLAAADAPWPGKDDEDAGIGDPAFILLVPTEQFRTDYVFLAPDKYAQNYVTIVLPTGVDLQFDGVTVDEGSLEDLGLGDHRVARFLIEPGPHVVRAEAPVGVYVYGYDRYVSYGYPAGLDLAPINPVDETFPGAR